MKSVIISVLIGIVLVGGAIMLSQKEENGAETVPVNNVSVRDGKQVVTISAKGGYSPKLSTLKADMPAVLRVETKGSFDCSSSLSIPAISYQKNLPPSGVTEIELPSQKAGSVIEGLCSMGMYKFEIAFK